MLGVGFACVAVISRFYLEWYSNISGKTIETKMSSPLVETKISLFITDCGFIAFHHSIFKLDDLF